MGVMSEMFGMGRPGDDDMNFHDLDGEGCTAEAPEAGSGQFPSTVVLLWTTRASMQRVSVANRNRDLCMLRLIGCCVECR